MWVNGQEKLLTQALSATALNSVSSAASNHEVCWLKIRRRAKCRRGKVPSMTKEGSRKGVKKGQPNKNFGLFGYRLSSNPTPILRLIPPKSPLHEP
ncbi:hypothetical protein PIB30_092199 [Stylosanthes scabra]|uniref:Uncharacterized protein n=1 Tax=Stylosanthes scabra TaxID=79078 RepID=A0ABU6UTJ2_9FABA|nr:hypothetical protein [Stylosanthes scabra]